MDYVFSMHCVVLNGIILVENRNINTRTIITYAFVLIWAFRLSIYLVLRPKNGEDFRYKAMRDKWMAVSTGYYYFMAFFAIYML